MSRQPDAPGNYKDRSGNKYTAIPMIEDMKETTQVLTRKISDQDNKLDKHDDKLDRIIKQLDEIEWRVIEIRKEQCSCCIL